MSSSTDSPIDINGADSGFHESLPATNSVDSSNAVHSGATDNQQYAANEFEYDEGLMSQLTDMGFPPEACKRALYYTKVADIDVVMNWLQEHIGDVDYSTPFNPSVISQSSFVPDENSVAMIESMGFTVFQASKALQITNNNLERAVDWIFSHPEQLEEKVPMNCSGPGAATAPKFCDGPETDTQSPEKDSEDNDCDDAASSSSEFSDCSSQDFDHIPDGRYHYVQQLIESGKDPRHVLMEMLPSYAMLPPNLSSSNLWQLVLSAIREPPPRTKLPHVNTIDDVVSLLQKCKNIIVLTGAGVSVSCGIPDFRSRNGVYARLSKDYPDLPEPKAMFDISYFKKDPRPFFKFAKEIYPGQFQPSPSHYFIKLLEKQRKLLRNYTQNIDTLEREAQIKNVVECHGSFATATCTLCKYQTDSEEIRQDIFHQKIPYCPYCPKDGLDGERGILKPDIVFFGEKLSDEFHDSLAEDRYDCDLLIVIGSSLKVRPVSTIPSKLPPQVPQILINREPLPHLNFDVQLLGDSDVIIGELCRRLSNTWEIQNIPLGEPLKEIDGKYLDTFYEKDEWAGTPFQMFHSGSVRSSSIANNSSALRPNGSFAPPEEESNSCDYRGMSAIKLDDSQDCSTSETPNVVPECSPDEAQSHSKVKIDPKASFLTPPYFLPEGTYLFDPPSRYIFPGAELAELLSRPHSVSISPPPHLSCAHTDSSSLSSEDVDYEAIAVPGQEILASQLPEGDLSCLSNSEDPSLATSPNANVPSSSSQFNHQKEETS